MLTSNFTDVTNALWMGTNDGLVLNHLLQSVFVLGCARTMSDCDVSSQDAFYSSSVKVDQRLDLKFSLLEFSH